MTETIESLKSKLAEVEKEKDEALANAKKWHKKTLNQKRDLRLKQRAWKIEAATRGHYISRAFCAEYKLNKIKEVLMGKSFLGFILATNLWEALNQESSFWRTGHADPKNDIFALRNLATKIEERLEAEKQNWPFLSEETDS